MTLTQKDRELLEEYDEYCKRMKRTDFKINLKNFKHYYPPLTFEEFKKVINRDEKHLK